MESARLGHIGGNNMRELRILETRDDPRGNHRFAGSPGKHEPFRFRQCRNEAGLRSFIPIPDVPGFANIPYVTGGSNTGKNPQKNSVGRCH
jgi:hypothetical protein